MVTIKSIISNNTSAVNMYQQPYHHGNLSAYRFLVTGGAGFIGSHIVEYLLSHGAKQVRVLDNLATGRLQNIEAFKTNPAFEFLEGDIRQLSTCRQACEGIDFVSHQAALGSVPRSIKEPFTTNDVNVGGFVNMLTAAKDAGVKKLVYASSSSVYGDEKTLPKTENKIGSQLSPYAVSKYTNELYASVFNKTYGLPLTGLRYFNIFGPRQDPKGQYAAVIPLFVDKLKNNEEVYIDGDGEQTRDFTFVANAVQANILAMLSPIKDAPVFNIAVGENFSVNQLYYKIAGLLGSKQKPLYRTARAGDVRNSLADIAKAQQLLGYQPQFNFEQGIALTVQAMR